MTTFHDFPTPPYYGAPMGRRSDTDITGPVLIRRVPFGDGGDYDPGGAYWGGGGEPLFCAWDVDGNAVYLRAKDLETAKSKLPTGVSVFDDGDSLKTTIRDGAATIFWGSAWADHAEEHDCCNLSGAEITGLMPEIPADAVKAADDMITGYENANHCTIAELWAHALRANGGRGDPERFGECLAWMAMGAGVSWFDDHEEFPLEDYDCENCDLRYLADETCSEETDRKPCEKCGMYRTLDEIKCSNCSAKWTVPCACCGKHIAVDEAYGDGDIGDEDDPSFCSAACYDTGPSADDGSTPGPVGATAARARAVDSEES